MKKAFKKIGENHKTPEKVKQETMFHVETLNLTEKLTNHFTVVFGETLMNLFKITLKK
jgi:hypothetical protein